MPSIERSIIIDASVDRVWEELTDNFASIGRWASGLESSSELAGTSQLQDTTSAGRACVAPGFGEVTERFTRLDRDRKRFSYTVEGLPSFVKRVENTWQVTAHGPSRTTATMSMNMETKGIGKLMGPMMAMNLKKQIKAMQADLKHYLETGTISEAKRKANAKLAKEGKPVQAA